VLKRLKILALTAAEGLGLSRVILQSEWRSQRLLILCYHGISLDDEHLWDPSLFMPAETLRDRLACLRKMRCNLLGFDEAFRRLRDGSLPPRAVTVTFDDGTYDFLVRAMPFIRQFEVPTTLYLATYYSFFNRPIYDLAVDYVLWKARGRHRAVVDALKHEIGVVEPDQRATITSALRRHAHAANLSPEEKDQLLTRVADICAVDLEAIRRKRILHVMTPEEAASVVREGVDIQLHTHRHRVYEERLRFDAGIDDNRVGLQSIRPGVPEHFCYPGGVYRDEFVPWLQTKGIRTATTCDAGLASQSDSPWLLPRLVDTTTLTLVEFRGWIAGVAAALPKRAHTHPQWMLVRRPERANA
jgi:peptidoglycan/xylan/chitin deacetylase (PgdA/CDA1 family)